MDSHEVKPKKKIQSSIPELTVGEERKLFNQIRKSAAYITPDTLLFNGWTAGGFALTYIIQHHMKRKRKAEEKITTEGSNKRSKKTFEDPLTITSLDDDLKQDGNKPKPKRRATSKKLTPGPPPKLERQSAVELEFTEIKDVSEANLEQKEIKPKPAAKKKAPTKAPTKFPVNKKKNADQNVNSTEA